MCSNYIVSARKYRPSTFNSVVGQKALTATLKNAIATDRLAHAYLFCGSRGVGKTSCARIFAKTINCEHPTPDGDPCNECESCKAFNEGRSLNIIELDAASNNGVDDMRALIEQVLVPPSTGRFRVFIIDEVHMLSTQAFNAFLKTLEEPPSYAVFILATTEKHKIIPTIMSRCQIYDFNRITIADMVDHLEYVAQQEGYSAERQALRVIASKADGAMRDALSIFDQVAASSRGDITYRSTIDNLNVLDSAYYSRLVDCFADADVPGALLIYKEVRDNGFDAHFFINGLGGYLRDLMVSLNPATMTLLDYDDETKATLAAQAAKCTPQFFYSAMSLCNSADLNYRTASNKNFLVELLLIKLCQLLSPSPNCSGDGEGQLKPIAASQPATAPSATAPSATTTTSAPTATRTEPAAAKATPYVPPQPSPSPRRHASLSRGPRLSLKASIADTDESATDTGSRHETVMSTPFTDDDLRAAWHSFADSHPTEKILINTMRSAEPAPTGAGSYNVMVETDIQAELLNKFMHDITRFCRDKVSNSSVTFSISVNDGAPSPHTWNEREVLAHMLQTPAFKEFVNALNLSLL